MRYLLLFALNLLAANTLSAQTLSGTVTDPFGAPIADARVTIFLVDTTEFREARTDANGVYLFENLGPYNFLFGVAKPRFAYFENVTNVIVGTVVHDAQLVPETELGRWDIIMQSPEALGGTDLGVLMPNGSIYYCHNTKDPFYFEPTENDTSFAKGSNFAQGCVAPALLLNGKVLFAGGTLEDDGFGPGSKKIKIFDPATGLWPYQPDMLDSRWYPTLSPLYDQRLLIVGGGDQNTGQANAKRTKTSEVYDPATGITQWADTIKFGNEVSAVVPLFTGKVLMTFRPPQLFDPSTLQWDLAADFVQGNRMPNGDHCDHEIVLRPNGNVVAIGYKSFTPGQPGVNVEIYDPIQNTWTLGSNFSPTRSRAKAVQLPDEKILVMGGHKEETSDPSPVNNWGYMGITDQYDPANNTWRRLANMNWKREYHAITILVPDGRVIAVGGEGQPGNEPPLSIIEAYKPPYLFRGIRPELSNFNKTEFKRGEHIEFKAHKTNALTKVMLMSHAVMTHFMNSGNGRCLELDFTQNGDQVNATLPSDSLHLMPGWYMLFGMVDDIPSVAQIVHILPGPFVMMETPPTAGFMANPNSGCAPLTVQFTNTSSANATDFNWQFPGGLPSSSTEQNPSVVYSTPGVYAVTLTASNAAGSATASQLNIVTVSPEPTADFGASIVGATVSFSNSSANATSYSWGFGDGQTSIETSPSHTYASDGTYTVTLSASNACGTVLSTQTIVIITPPTAGFTATPMEGCTPLTVQFTNTSSANATDFSWQFPGGDPAVSTSQNPSVVYNAPGTYSVTFTASNAAGSSTASQPNIVIVNPAPTADFSAVVAGATASFSNSSANATSYSWSFGDGQNSAETNPSHTYNNDGTYTVTLTVSGPCGIATATQVVTITTVSTKDPSQAASIQVFPNPIISGGTLTAIMNLKRAGSVHFDLMDASGKVIREYPFSEKTIGSQVFNLKTVGLPEGTYFLTANMNGEKIATEKLILK
ncbi:MAG: PKD domain-containing protein [Phycisphaerae bacterium]|nr:PKD domain-containing protein [Saprospiraceae bacterium]